jgi:hypothetical protein
MKKLLITGCSDYLLWYAKKIGQEVPFVREDNGYFWSREDTGYLNIVFRKDAHVINSGGEDSTKR